MVTITRVETHAHMADAMKVRFEVFVGEQNVSPEGEHDALDDDVTTVHCVAYGGGGEILGAGRLIAPFKDSVHGDGVDGEPMGAMNPANPHIGRVAVAKRARGTGAGRLIMEFLEAEALARFGSEGSVTVELSAQDQAAGFYQHLGYTIVGAAYLDEGISHHDAFKVVTA